MIRPSNVRFRTLNRTQMLIEYGISDWMFTRSLYFFGLYKNHSKMGRIFHSIPSLCSKDVTFPYIPYQKSKLYRHIFNEFQEHFQKSSVSCWFSMCCCCPSKFPQSVVIRACFLHRIRLSDPRVRNRIFRSDQDVCKLSQRIQSRNHFMAVKCKVQSWTRLEFRPLKSQQNLKLLWKINLSNFLLNHNFDILNKERLDTGS